MVGVSAGLKGHPARDAAVADHRNHALSCFFWSRATAIPKAAEIAVEACPHRRCHRWIRPFQESGEAVQLAGSSSKPFHAAGQILCHSLVAGVPDDLVLVLKT